MEEDRINRDQFYPLKDAARLMGLKSPEDVKRLHEQGKIDIRSRAVRGTTGRSGVLGSDIIGFNRNLPIKPRRDAKVVSGVKPLKPLRRRTSLRGVESFSDEDLASSGRE